MVTYKEDVLGTPVSVLTTELNSLANATLSGAGATAIDNSTNLYIFCGIEIKIATQGSARASGAYVAVYFSQDLVGASTQDLTIESPIFTVQALDAATTARTHSQSGLWLPPSASLKFAAYNGTGQVLAASGNTVKITPWYTKSV